MCGGCGRWDGSLQSSCVLTLLWWEAGCGERDLGEGCCLALMGGELLAAAIPFDLPSRSHSRVTIPCLRVLVGASCLYLDAVRGARVLSLPLTYIHI